MLAYEESEKTRRELADAAPARQRVLAYEDKGQARKGGVASNVSVRVTGIILAWYQLVAFFSPRFFSAYSHLREIFFFEHFFKHFF